MKNQRTVESNQTSNFQKIRLWKAAIKWPLYSVAVMPVLLAASWRIAAGRTVRIDQFIGFLLASILLLLWENLTNDLFDAETGIDQSTKPHSVVALIGNRSPVRNLAYIILFAGLLLIAILAIRSNYLVLCLVLGSCALGYLYQGPPFRLGYLGLGEPLCWIAFGPLATAAAILVLGQNTNTEAVIPWVTALKLGSGPAVATTLVLFCSHFHQVANDAAHGKQSPLVRLGTHRSARLIPWFITLTLVLEWLPVFQGHWPISSLLGIIGLPSGIALIRLLKNYHNQPERISHSKFIALQFQTLNGLGLSLGLAMAPGLGMNLIK